jgi:hypothetical protein
MTETPEKVEDPFSPESAPGVSLVVQLRIYDVLLAMLNEMSPDKAEALMDLHATGALMAPPPMYNGVFVYEQDRQEESA